MGSVLASITKSNGKWRVQIHVNGKRRSKVLSTKLEAQRWATKAEYEIEHRHEIAEASLFGVALDRYAREVSPKKKGAKWEDIRLTKFQTYPIARIAMKDLQPSDFASWRDGRLLEVKGASVRREMQLLSAVLTTARKEWGWISQNPISDVQKPPNSPRRKRTPTPCEMDKLALAAGSDMRKATCRAFASFRFAVETGMRAGEIVSMQPDQVSISRRVAHLPETKNGEARDVPLSSAALSILEDMLGRQFPEGVFGLRSDNLDRLWRKVRDRAKIEGLTFHDSRHAAITQLAKKLEVLDLARMVGHKDLKMLLIYYETDAEALADKLG